jgi:CIC family chloride channel protein
MLAVAIATGLSRGLSYGTIYTTKLLRRGTDLDRATPWRALHDVKLADAMCPRSEPEPELSAVPVDGRSLAGAPGPTAAPAAPISREDAPPALHANESLTRALRALIDSGHEGLPVLSADGSVIEGWVTTASAIQAIARDLGATKTAS